jgi:hypothetical protein
MEPFLLSTILIRVIAVMLIGAVLGGAFALGRFWRFRSGGDASPELTAQLRRLEAAIDRLALQGETSAIELERVAESQRFLTQVLGRDRDVRVVQSLPSAPKPEEQASAARKHLTPT